MDQLFETLASPEFSRIMFSLSIVTMVLALGVVLVAFAFYGRARESIEETDSWTMLFATWRDSMIITLLFVAEGLLFRMSDLQAMSNQLPSSVLLYAPAMLPIGSTILYVLIFTVAALRIVVLSNWLARKA